MVAEKLGYVGRLGVAFVPLGGGGERKVVDFTKIGLICPFPLCGGSGGTAAVFGLLLLARRWFKR